MSISMVVNRTSKLFEFRFDGTLYEIPPGPEPVPMDTNIAWHGFMKSAYGIDKYLNTGRFKIGIVGAHKVDMIDEDSEGRSMDSYLDHELIGDIEGSKYIDKSIANRMEISGDGSSPHVVLSNKAEGT